MSDIEYKEIKENDIGTVAKLGLSTTRSHKKVANNEGDLWTTLVGFMDTQIEWTALENLEDPKKILDALKKVLHKAFLTEFSETKITWSADERTKAACKYLSDIKKIAEHGCCGSLVPGDGTVGARCGVLALCKVEKTPLQKLKYAVDQVISSSENIGDSDAVEALALFDLMSGEVKRLTALN